MVVASDENGHEGVRGDSLPQVHLWRIHLQDICPYHVMEDMLRLTEGYFQNTSDGVAKPSRDGSSPFPVS